MTANPTMNAILQLLICFPSIATINQSQAAEMAMAYMVTLKGFESSVILSACDALRKRATPFPPSSGEVYAECERQQFAKAKMTRWEASGMPMVTFERLALSAPRSDYSVEQMADWALNINGFGGEYHMRVDSSGAPLKIPFGHNGAGMVVSYGYLTKYETEEFAAARRNIKRSSADSV